MTPSLTIWKQTQNHRTQTECPVSLCFDPLVMNRILTNLPPQIYHSTAPLISNAMFTLSNFVEKSCTIAYTHDSIKPPKTPVIYTMWHGHLPFLMIHHGSQSDTRTLLVQQKPYMTATVLWSEMLGLRIKRGGGKGDPPAIPLLLNELKEERNSIILAVDGPYGPRHVMKPGAVEIARATGYPIVHVEYQCKRATPMEGRWDKRLVPSLFDDILVTYHPPIFVDNHDNNDNDFICRRIEKKLLE